MTRPYRRLSIWTYGIDAGGKTIVLQRVGRSGFKIVMQRGRQSPLFRRLRDAAHAAIEAANPWPFTVEKKFDGALDLPRFLDRRSETAVAP